jgi:hypothetical protein
VFLKVLLWISDLLIKEFLSLALFCNYGFYEPIDITTIDLLLRRTR